MAEKATQQLESVDAAAKNRQGKYLTFALGNEQYGLEILKVREIIGYVKVTRIPQTPDYIHGVINLRGRVIPVVDLRARFGMESVERTEATCIIVVEISRADDTISTGVVVDRVQEVLDITSEQIEGTPEFGSSVDTNFILGIGKIGESVKILLDIDKVLGGDEMAQLAETE
jgi:purine-binding chemotaxis protein CheW